MDPTRGTNPEDYTTLVVPGHAYRNAFVTRRPAQGPPEPDGGSGAPVVPAGRRWPSPGVLGPSRPTIGAGAR